MEAIFYDSTLVFLMLAQISSRSPNCKSWKIFICASGVIKKQFYKQGVSMKLFANQLVTQWWYLFYLH